MGRPSGLKDPTDASRATGNGIAQTRVYVLLAVILALAAFLRFHSITERGFFFDELWIVQVSNGHGSAFMDLPTDRLIEEPNTLALSQARPIWTVPAHTTGVIHPPGLFVMLRLWREVFGDSMLALRGFSATWSTLAVLLVFVAGRMSFNASVGLWAALMSAVAFNNIDQAQDTRGYTMLQCELLLTMIALLAIRDKRSSWRGASAIGVGVLAMMFTHYFAAGACAAIVFGVVTLLRGRTRVQTLAAIAVAGIVWTMLWLPHLRAQLAFVPETADTFLADHSESPLLSELQRVAASLYQAMIGDPRKLDTITIVGGLIAAIVIALGLRRATGDEKRLTRVWLAVIVGVFGSLLALDLARQTTHLEQPKYLVLTTPAICVLLASASVWRSWLVPALASVALSVLLFTTPVPAKPDQRPVTRWLKEHVRPEDVVFLPSHNPLGRDGQVMSLHLAYELGFDRLRMVIPVRKPTASELGALPRDVRWFYFAFDRALDPTDRLPGVEIVERGPVGISAAYEIRPRPRTSATTRSTTRP